MRAVGQGVGLRGPPPPPKARQFMEKHIIRLGGAWESPIEGEASALWVRRFGRPTEMCAQARVFLVFTDTMAGELSLNNTHLPAIQANAPRWECDITPLLCEPQCTHFEAEGCNRSCFQKKCSHEPNPRQTGAPARQNPVARWLRLRVAGDCFN